MTRSLLVRGLLVGLAAGFIAFLVARILGEPAVAASIAVEEAGHVHTAGEVELVSRDVQSTIGLATALLAFGASIGGLFGLAYALAQGRLGTAGARTTSALLALAGFVTLNLVPFIKYPANPPAVGHAETIGQRTGLYFSLLVLSVLAAVAAVWVTRRLGDGVAAWDKALTGVGVYVALMALVMLLLPSVNEVGPDFPASTLWSFRVGALATQLAVWATLGLLFGALTDRAMRRAARPDLNLTAA